MSYEDFLDVLVQFHDVPMTFERFAGTVECVSGLDAD